MKIKYYLFLVVLAVWSCSNDDNGAVSDLVGEWTWVQSTGGLAGVLQTPESIGVTRSLSFTATTFQSFEDGELVHESNYTLGTEESLVFNEPRQMLLSNLGVRNIVELDGPKLILIGDCFDCVTSTYTKVIN